MKYLGIYDYDRLIQQEPKQIQKGSIDFVQNCKDKRGLSYQTIHTYLNVIKHFYDFNEVTLSWRIINAYKPEYQKVAEDEPYTTEEIDRLIEGATPRDRAIILL